MTSQNKQTVARNPESARGFDAALQVLQSAIAERAFPGCAFGVFAAGEVIFSGAAGRFTYEPDAPAVTAGTVYDVASLTKVVATTATAMLLVQSGKLDLAMPLGQVLPGFVANRTAGDPAQRLMLRHLLAHNSGLPGYVELFRYANTPGTLLERCFALPVEAEPGTRAEYSDPGFILLGKALEKVIGEGLDSFARREIFEPLGMALTEFRPIDTTRSAIPPTEEDTRFRHRRIQGEVQDENAFVLGGVAGHAGLFSNVADLLRFAETILRATKMDGDEQPRLFDRATLNRFATRQEPAGSSWALGWDTPSNPSSTGTQFSAHSIGHLGYSGCSLWIDLDAALAVVLLTNRTWPDRSSRLIRSVRRAFHDAIRNAL